jgi:hypothetical protein
VLVMQNLSFQVNDFTISAMLRISSEDYLQQGHNVSGRSENTVSAAELSLLESL